MIPNASSRSPSRVATLVGPLLAVLLSLAWFGGRAMPPRTEAGAPDLGAFGRLPVVYQGRVKPFDTLARNSLVILSDRQTWRDEEGRRRPAIEWLLDVTANVPRAREHRVFRVHSLELLDQLGLEPRRGYRYALAEFEDRLGDVELEAIRASRLDPDDRDLHDVKLLEFWQHTAIYRVLADVHAFSPVNGSSAGGIAGVMRRLERLERFPLPHAIPPAGPEEEWRSFPHALVDGASSGAANPAVPLFAATLEAWAAGDVERFDGAVYEYQSYLEAHPPRGARVLGFETFFNRFAPFYRCAVLYAIAFTLSILGWLFWPRLLRRSVTALLIVTFVVHTFAIAARVSISGYPPITNLYGTAVFIGWGCVLLGLILERIFAMGIGNLIASVVGFLTLLIAHFLAGDGDTLEMMQAVLDTKFWLATHVIVINFGYSATFLAGGLSVLYVLRGVLTRSLEASVEQALGRMIYGILCFALLLSFVGTVLGGLWADDSWGRFWGWDPKENGALMIVLWNALILHARWGGMIRTRGLAVLSVFGSIVTAWSWFGVNQLGVGLHSYGFTESVTTWLLIFVASQLLVIGLGLLPRRWWRSAPPAARRHPGPARSE